MTDIYAVAFVGTGETSAANVAALLADFLSEDNDYNPPIFPAEVKQHHVGLSRAYDWVCEEFGQENVDHLDVSDIVAELQSQRSSDKAKPFVIYAPGENDEHADVVEAARLADIPVLDLTAGLDDFAFPAEPESIEPVAEDDAPRPRRTRGVPRNETPKLDEPVETKADDVWADEIEANKGRSDPPWEVEPEIGQDGPELVTPVFPAATPGVQVTLSQATVDLLLATFSSLAQDVATALVPKPKSQMVAVYVTEDGDYRRVEGKGRPRKGETRTEITVEQAEELGL